MECNQAQNPAAKYTLTESQVKKIRKKGSKEGTPCHYPRCLCDNYDHPPGIARTSWLAMCSECKHSESEHRLATTFDQQVKAWREKSSNYACVGCDMMCDGFHKQDDSIASSSPLAKQCVSCKHNIDCHRPETAVDKYIQSMIAARNSHQCRKVLEGKELTSSSGLQSGRVVVGESDDTAVLPWFEPTNVDPDEWGKLAWVSKQCKCRGFSYGGDLARVFQTYHGLDKETVTPYMPFLACQHCSHILKAHREPNDKENKLQVQKMKDHMTLSGVKSLLTTSTTQSQDAVGIHMVKDTGDNLSQIAVARVECHTGEGYLVIVTVIPVIQDQRDKMESKEGESELGCHDDKESKKKRKMTGIFEEMKQKLKKRKTTDGSSAESKSAIENNKAGNTNATFMQCIGQIDDSQYSMPIDCGIGEPTCLEWGTVAGDAEVSFKDDLTLTLAMGSEDGTVVVFTIKDGSYQCLATDSRLPDESSVNKLVWHPGCHTLVSGHTNGAVVLWNCSFLKGKMIMSKVLRERKNTVTALAANTRFLAIGYDSGDIIFYELLAEKSDVLKPKLTTCTSNAYGSVTCITWHPEKNIVACGGEDDNITIFHYHTATASQRRGSIRQYFSPRRFKKPNQFHKCCILKGHTSFVSSVTFDLTSEVLFSSGWDGQLFFWSTAEIDDIISAGDDVCDVVFQSGFAIGQGQRSQVSTTFSESSPSPFVPLQAIVHKGSVFLAVRCCQDRVHLVIYEIPHCLM